MQGKIEGQVSSGFESVCEAFQSLFEDLAETGAAVAVTVQGEQVVDLWGGYRDKAGELPWQRDTRCNIFSASKGLVALTVLQLADEGLLHLDDPVARYWPEFGCAGKESVSIAQVLCHRSGVNAFHQRVSDDLIYDWSAVTEAIAAEHPWWEPGAQQGYSPIFSGWILGELVRRVSGSSSFSEYLQVRVARPLGAGLGIGIPLAQQEDLADMGPIKRIQKVSGAGLLELMRADPRGMVNRAFTNPPSLMVGTNGERWRSAQIPAANVHASAADLAGVYGSLVCADDTRLLSGKTLPECWTERSSGLDSTLNNPVSYSRGFMRMKPLLSVASERAFGHPGAGGSLGLGDPQLGLGFGFVSRSMGQAILLDERADRLLQAVYRAAMSKENS